ncbi:DUF2891 domain-containing protein [soil metagenome]
MRYCVLFTAGVLVTASPAGGDDVSLDAALAARFADLALACVHEEYPNKIAHVLQSDADVAPPRKLTPAFYGCYDWHSAVHGHWLLARLARLYPDADFANSARAALERSLTVDHLQEETRYLAGAGRVSFERPYGLAWLLQLTAELRQWDDDRAQQWRDHLAPLEALAVERLAAWLPKLDYPIRAGEHSQTAFAFGLMLDWTHAADDDAMRRLLEERARAYYLDDRDCPLAYEPSGEDFLSPCFAEADLMRRVLDPPAYAKWLDAFLPTIPCDGSATWIEPARASDPSDPKLAHLDGLNLSRAWMLEGIAAGLRADDSRRPSLLAAAATHRRAGLVSVTGEHYEGGHWLGSFATYLFTERGLDPG